MISKKQNKNELFFKRPETSSRISSPGLYFFSPRLSLSGERKAIFAREKKKERNTRVSARTVWSFLSVSFRREREREREREF